MGKVYIEEQIIGATLEEAYATACREADERYGRQENYSGKINSTAGVSDLTEEWFKTKLDISEFVNKRFENNYRGAPLIAICSQKPIANKNAIQTQVEHNVFKGTRKWELLYVPYILDPVHGFIPKQGRKTKAEAVKDARKYTASTRLSSKVVLEKSLITGDVTVASISYKPSSKERPGIWDVYGYASE